MSGKMAQSRSGKPPRGPEHVRKLGTNKNMIAAIKKIEEGLGLYEAARQCNVPVETLHRQMVGAVSVDCKPGPP